MEITGAPVVLAPEKAKKIERFMEELSTMQDVSDPRFSKRLP